MIHTHMDVVRATRSPRRHREDKHRRADKNDTLVRRSMRRHRERMLDHERVRKYAFALLEPLPEDTVTSTRSMVASACAREVCTMDVYKTDVRTDGEWELVGVSCARDAPTSTHVWTRWVRGVVAKLLQW